MIPYKKYAPKFESESLKMIKYHNMFIELKLAIKL